MKPIPLKLRRLDGVNLAVRVERTRELRFRIALAKGLLWLTAKVLGSGLVIDDLNKGAPG